MLDLKSPLYWLWIALIALFVALGHFSWIFYVITGLVWALVAIPAFWFIVIKKEKA